MRILILGGTIFLGRHVTESALARGHEVVWAEEEFLAEHGVRPFLDMPLFTGTGAPGLATRNGARARAAGITFRPMEETVRDTIAWAREDGRELPLKAGLDPAREAELLAGLAGPETGGSE